MLQQDRAGTKCARLWHCTAIPLLGVLTALDPGEQVQDGSKEGTCQLPPYCADSSRDDTGRLAPSSQSISSPYLLPMSITRFLLTSGLGRGPRLSSEVPDSLPPHPGHIPCSRSLQSWQCG